MPRTTVTTGDLAVTVKYADGTEMQLLPAIKPKSGIRMADPGANTWSTVVHPDRFGKKLTQINQRNDKKVIPTIKLAKGLIAHSVRSDRDQISGYHVESLAIEAFRNYRGSHDLKSMLRHFNDFASGEVMQPIKDPTGQSAMWKITWVRQTATAGGERRICSDRCGGAWTVVKPGRTSRICLGYDGRGNR